MYNTFLKRTTDILISLITVLLLSPVFLITILVLWIANNGSPFFLQIRPGKNEKLFSIIKFKTMTDRRDKENNLLPDEKRITKIGHSIRLLSLDEIPQLINVLKGDMSIVGPRPLLPEYLPLYNNIQKQRHDVRHGITGWAQVNGRNTISWTEKFNFDVWYVKNLSFLLDIRIIILTIEKVLKRKDISSETSETMEKFNGTN